MTWTLADIPSQSGRIALVTGATRGLGLEVAKALATAGATVVLAGRDRQRGEDASAEFRRAGWLADFEPLDLGDPADVTRFAARLMARLPKLDLLVNNAGVMAIPQRLVTAAGFETQFGVNYLGHFALSARLMPALRLGRARVVSLASLAHRRGRIDFDDLQSERGYRPWTAYQQSKLAMLMFARELQRRSQAAGWGITSVAAHPGVAMTELFETGPGIGRGGRSLERTLIQVAGPLFAQTAARGALPILYAATSPDAQPGGYYGPDGFHEMQGNPAPARVSRRAADDSAASRLWELSERLCAIGYPAV